MCRVYAVEKMLVFKVCDVEDIMALQVYDVDVLMFQVSDIDILVF